MNIEKIKKRITTYPNWPKEGVMFRDGTDLMKGPDGFKMVIDDFYEQYKDKNIDVVVGIDARGFIIGGALAQKLKTGFVPVRKEGKLPGKVWVQEYELEYGKDTLTIHRNACPKKRVLIVDDLIATGGTLDATIELVKQAEGIIVSCAAIIDLPDLGGSKMIRDKGIDVYTQCEFEGE